MSPINVREQERGLHLKVETKPCCQGKGKGEKTVIRDTCLVNSWGMSQGICIIKTSPNDSQAAWLGPIYHPAFGNHSSREVFDHDTYVLNPRSFPILPKTTSKVSLGFSEPGHPFYVKSKVVQGKDIHRFLDSGGCFVAWKSEDVLLAFPGQSKLLLAVCTNWYEKKSLS